MPGSALLLIRLLLLLLAVGAAWRFGLRGVVALLLTVLAALVLLKGRRLRRDMSDRPG
jgi:hypothetical protein